MIMLSLPSNQDFNYIESLWGIMKRNLRSDPQRTVVELTQKITEICITITPKDCKNLINTMPV